MCAEDDCRGRCGRPGDLSDDGLLRPRVRELGDGHARLAVCKLDARVSLV